MSKNDFWIDHVPLKVMPLRKSEAYYKEENKNQNKKSSKIGTIFELFRLKFGPVLGTLFHLEELSPL